MRHVESVSTDLAPDAPRPVIQLTLPTAVAVEIWPLGTPKIMPPYVDSEDRPHLSWSERGDGRYNLDSSDVDVSTLEALAGDGVLPGGVEFLLRSTIRPSTPCFQHSLLIMIREPMNCPDDSLYVLHVTHTTIGTSFSFSSHQAIFHREHHSKAHWYKGKSIAYLSHLFLVPRRNSGTRVAENWHRPRMGRIIPERQAASGAWLIPNPS